MDKLWTNCVKFCTNYGQNVLNELNSGQIMDKLCQIVDKFWTKCVKLWTNYGQNLRRSYEQNMLSDKLTVKKGTQLETLQWFQ